MDQNLCKFMTEKSLEALTTLLCKLIQFLKAEKFWKRHTISSNFLKTAQGIY